VARTCTVCSHGEREEIDRRLVAGGTFRNIAERFGTSAAALYRHKDQHLRELLARAVRHEEVQAATLQAQVDAQEDHEQARAINLMDELRQAVQTVHLVRAACDRYLRDPDDPTRYDVSPRAEDVQVIYVEPGLDGKPVRKKERLSYLLGRLEGGGVGVDRAETKYADPRDLILKTVTTLQGPLELFAKLVGDLDERPQVNVLVAPEWVQVRAAVLAALRPYPEARAAVADRLLALEAA